VQRTLTTLILLCFAIGPGLNVECLVRCAPKPVAAAPTDHCHHPVDSGLQLSASAEGVEHQAAPAPAVIVSRSETASASLAGPVAHILRLNPNQLSGRVTSIEVPIVGPSLSLSAIPLRI